MTFISASRVEWIDTDAAGIYHNSTVVRFVESAEAALIRECGLDGYFPSAPRVRYEVDFLSPLFFGQAVITELSIAHLGSSSMRFEFCVWGETFEGRDRAQAARGSYVTVHIDRESGHGTGRAVASPWPESWRTALAPYVSR